MTLCALSALTIQSSPLRTVVRKKDDGYRISRTGQNLLGGDAPDPAPEFCAPGEFGAPSRTSGRLGCSGEFPSWLVAFRVLESGDSVEVTGISMDSRGVRPQDLTWLCPVRRCGAQFAEAALKLGASAIFDGSLPVPGTG